jgi:hypothetical protein
MIKVYGPYMRGDGRKHIILYDTELKKRTTLSYPKFLLQKKIGRKLVGDETTDHIDEDFTNDELENLQILSLAVNAAKSNKIIGEYYNCCNPKCTILVFRTPSQLKRKKKIYKFIACSNKCRGIGRHIHGT